MSSIRTALALFTILLSNSVAGQSGEESAELTVTRWAVAMVNRDQEGITRCLSEAYEKVPTAQILEYNSYTPLERVDLSAARYEFAGDTVRVRPIIAHRHLPSALSLTLIKNADGQWRILKIENAELPKEFAPVDLPKQIQTTPVSISLRDRDTGKPVHARIRLIDERNRYWPPRWHETNIADNFGRDVGGDLTIGEMAYAYVEPDFVADLAVGRYSLEVLKGMEYLRVAQSFDVRESGSNTVNVRIPRWINMESKGWYSGDNHVHFMAPNDVLLQMQAEDLNAVNLLLVSPWNSRLPVGRAVQSLPDHVLYVSQEITHDWLGHLVLNGIKERVYPESWGDNSWTGVPGGFDFPAMVTIADATRAQGGMVNWAHFAVPSGELPIDMALGKVDAVEVVGVGDPYVRPQTGDPEELSAIEWWYTFLNLGFKVPATAGSDVMSNRQLLGSSRIYARSASEDFDYQSWIDSIRKGKSFVTTGPMISMKANGQDIGSVLQMTSGDQVNLEVEVHSPYEQYPVDRVDIVQNGEVIASVENTSRASIVKLKKVVKVTTSAWFASRANGQKVLPYNAWPLWEPMRVTAHTNPIYADVGGTRIWSKSDAEFVIKRCDLALHWVKSEASFRTDEQRREMIRIFEEGRGFYLKQQKLNGQPYEH